jgi:hypothetical protein
MRSKGWLLMVCVLGLTAGCITGTDPVTGEKTYSVDPNAAGKVEAVAQAVGSLTPLLGPTGALVGGVILGAVGAWRKVKPSLTEARTQADHYHAATTATVEALEQFKESSPEAWTKLGELIDDRLSKQGIDPKTIENVIRAIRGLPPKA